GQASEIAVDTGLELLVEVLPELDQALEADASGAGDVASLGPGEFAVDPTRVEVEPRLLAYDFPVRLPDDLLLLGAREAREEETALCDEDRSDAVAHVVPSDMSLCTKV